MRTLQRPEWDVIWLRELQAWDNNPLQPWDVLLAFHFGVDWGLIESLPPLRECSASFVCVALTNMSHEEHMPYRIKLYEAGVDEVLSHLIHPRELYTKLKNRVLRSQMRAPQNVVLPGLVFQWHCRACYLWGERLSLTAVEYALLYTLAQKADHVIPRAALDAVHGQRAKPSLALDMHISNLRKKLPADAIKTIRGVGYMLNADIFASAAVEVPIRHAA